MRRCISNNLVYDGEIVQIFDKSVDYKEIYQDKFQIKQEVDLKKIEQSRTRSNKFNGTYKVQVTGEVKQRQTTKREQVIKQTETTSAVRETKNNIIKATRSTRRSKLIQMNIKRQIPSNVKTL
ncbi:unnamed protein product [Brachionus calyciflorus]|uniref:Uncharacterized protein n=1 Tax=Brachionus calyciflorus TaxID=104777 RepID=A0A813ZPM2_9BILA|nr:unnamed protein product [Brachionus calyciflorus]